MTCDEGVTMMLNLRISELAKSSLALSAFVLAVGCTSTLRQPLEGSVFDAASGKPLQGAVVIAVWKGNVGVVDSAHHCAHVETAVTGADGRFRVEGAPSGKGADERYDYRFVYAYQEGYSMVEVAAKNGPVRLGLTHGSPPDAGRVAEIGRNVAEISRLRCGIEDGSNKNVYRLHARQLAEMWRLAQPADDDALRSAQYHMELDLVDFRKPTRDVWRPELRTYAATNVSPTDAFRPEDILK